MMSSFKKSKIKKNIILSSTIFSIIVGFFSYSISSQFLNNVSNNVENNLFNSSVQSEKSTRNVVYEVNFDKFNYSLDTSKVIEQEVTNKQIDFKLFNFKNFDVLASSQENTPTILINNDSNNPTVTLNLKQPGKEEDNWKNWIGELLADAWSPYNLENSNSNSMFDYLSSRYPVIKENSITGKSDFGEKNFFNFTFLNEKNELTTTQFNYVSNSLKVGHGFTGFNVSGFKTGENITTNEVISLKNSPILMNGRFLLTDSYSVSSAYLGGVIPTIDNQILAKFIATSTPYSNGSYYNIPREYKHLPYWEMNSIIDYSSTGDDKISLYRFEQSGKTPDLIVKYNGNMQQYASEVVSQIKQDSSEEINNLNFVMSLVSPFIIKNSKLRITSDDVNGKIKFEFIPKYFYVNNDINFDTFVEVRTYYPIGWVYYKLKNFYSTSLENNSSNEAIASFELSGFKKKTSSTTKQKTDTIDISNDDNFKLYTADEFLELKDCNEKISNKLYANRNEIFESLPTSFEETNIQDITLEKVDTQNIIVRFKINYFFRDDVLVNNDPNDLLDCSIKFTGFSLGSTDVERNKTINDYKNKNLAIPQFSVLKDNKELQKNFLFSNPKTKDEINKIPTIRAIDINDTFLKEVFDKVIIGNKNNLTYKDIDSIKLQFDNATGLVYLYAIKLNKHNDKTGLVGPKLFETFSFDKTNSLVCSKINVYDNGINCNFTIKQNFTVNESYKLESVNEIGESTLVEIISKNWIFETPNFIEDAALPYEGFDISELAKPLNVTIIKRDSINGLISIKPIYKNIYIDNVFYSEYEFPNQIQLNGFYAEKENTSIHYDAQNWECKASDVLNDSAIRNKFLEKFYNSNIKFPNHNSSWTDIKILDDPKPIANNVTGELTATLSFTNIVLVHGVLQPIVTEKVTIGGFERQYPTEFKENLILEAPIDETTQNPININDSNLLSKIKSSIYDTLINNPSLILDNIPSDFKETDFNINIINKDIKRKQVSLTIELYKYYDKNGILVENQIQSPLKSSFIIMQNFFVFKETTTNDFNYDVKKYLEILSKNYFVNPNSIVELKQLVLDAFNYQKNNNLNSLPELSIDDFSISINDSKYNENLDISYGLGNIYLKVNLYKYYNSAGEEINNVDKPLIINLELFGWKKLISAYKSSSINISLNHDENYNTDITNDQLKEVVWNHKNEIFNDEIPYYDDKEKFINNINIEIITLENPQKTEIILLCKITLLIYYNNGSFGNNLINENLRISGFTGISPTNFYSGNEIEANLLDVLPSDLFKQQSNINLLDNSFKNFIIDKLVLPNKIGITKNDILSIKFSSADNINGTIIINELVINAYNDYSPTKQPVTFTPNNGSGLKVTKLKSIKPTQVFKTTVNITEKNLNITDVTDKTLLRILREEKYISLIFSDTLPSADSINSVQIIKKVYLNDGTDITAPYIKTNVTLNSYYDSEGNLQEVPSSKPKIIELNFIGFNALEPTQLGSVDVSQEIFNEAFSGLGEISIKMFLPNVIDANWFVIQQRLINLINLCYKNYPSSFKNVNILSSDNKIAFATKKIVDSDGRIIFADPNANWDFLSNDLKLQEEAKKRISSAALKAIDSPDINNNFSWGKMQIQLRMINGLTIDKATGEIISGKLDSTQSLFTANCSSFSVDYQAKSSTPNTWIFIIGICSSIFVLIFVGLLIYKIIKRKQDKVLEKE